MISGRPSDKLLPPILLIAVTVLLLQFTRLPQFGLWEDDYWAIAPHLYGAVGNLWAAVVSSFTTWPQGRPLNHFLPPALSRVGTALGGLEGVYVLAAAWLALNGALVFLIVRRVISEAAALIAALTYLLFPADTTKILLVHAAHVQGAMTFLLLGVWLWLKGGPARIASYPVAGLTLLAFETTFLPFLAVPLLWAADRKSTIRTWVVHVISCTGIVALDAAIRFSRRDARVSDAADHTGRSIYRLVTSMYIGPLTSGRSLFVSAVTGLRQLDAFAALAGVLVVLGFVAVWREIQSRRVPVAEEAPAIWPDWLRQTAAQSCSLPWWWLLLGAMLVWCGSYALTLTDYPPTQTAGRLTSTHVAAAWPASLAVAALYEGARRRGHGGSRVAAGLFAVWLACMAGYHHYLQREYVRAWHLQQRFWRQVMTLAPEAGPGWTVIVDGIPGAGSPVIYSNAWSDDLVYRLIFTTGFGPNGPAFGHLGCLGRNIEFRRSGDTVEWRPQFWGGPFVRIDPSRLALLMDDHGVLRRVTELSTPIGTLVSAAPSTTLRTTWPPTPVSRLLFPERFQ